MLRLLECNCVVKSRRCLDACYHQLANFFEEYCDRIPLSFVSVSVLKIQITLPNVLLHSGCFGWSPHEFPMRLITSTEVKIGVLSRDVKREPSTEANFSKLNTLCQNSADLFLGSTVLTLLLSRCV